MRKVWRAILWFCHPWYHIANRAKPAHHTHISWKRWRIIRHSFGMCVGIAICYLGSFTAAEAEVISQAVQVVNHVWVDTVGYIMHGIGCVPILVHLEPLWHALLDEEVA